jgi:dTDP-4-dehydrorhamnose reductase
MNIILFGSSGMLGRYVYNVLKSLYNVICITRDQFDIENDEWSRLDYILSTNLNENDLIINCAGIIPQKYNNTNFKKYIRVNTLFPHKIKEIAKNRYKFIHITTDCVFDGLKGSYSITDKHNALDIYGISKSLGEPEETTIIRTSIIGEELTGKKSLIEWLKSNKNGKINGYINHYWNGITCLELAKYIKNIIYKNDFWLGIRNVFSPDIINKYDLCCYVNQIYELNINIEKYEDYISKNMTLCGDYIIEKTIFLQIIDLFEFID